MSEDFRQQLVKCLGGDWPEPVALDPVFDDWAQKDGYRLAKISYQVEPEDRVSAYFLVPDSVDGSNPASAVAVWHQHADQYDLGKSEPAGLAGDPVHHVGPALARLGHVVLCPDALCFEERQDPDRKLVGGEFERFEFLRYIVAGKCLAWKNILDMRRAVDFLSNLPEVDAARVGCFGHSMGATHTWLVGPHEPRLRALVGNCCFPTYSAIRENKLLHCFSNFIPGWEVHGDTPDIAALIAPRPLHMNLGADDEGSPFDHAKVGLDRIAKKFAGMGASDHFSSYVEPGTGHALSEEMWARTVDFFGRRLGTEVVNPKLAQQTQ